MAMEGGRTSWPLPGTKIVKQLLNSECSPKLLKCIVLYCFVYAHIVVILPPNASYSYMMQLWSLPQEFALPEHTHLCVPYKKPLLIGYQMYREYMLTLLASHINRCNLSTACKK